MGNSVEFTGRELLAVDANTPQPGWIVVRHLLAPLVEWRDAREPILAGKGCHEDWQRLAIAEHALMALARKIRDA